MRIVLASSEAVPFSKTGGLGDVATALPKALAQVGHDVSLFTPFYQQIIAKRGSSVPVIEPTGLTFRVTVGSKHVEGQILKSSLPGSRATVYLIEQPHYFNRPGLYVEQEQDYRDNSERFIFFSRAVMEATRLLNLKPDIIHANDWQTGLIPALFKIEFQGSPGFERTASIFTIHNMAFQGQFWHWDMLLTGLDWKYFNWRQMECYGHLNLLKTGIAFADLVTTVSPTYSREIQTAEFGCGLNAALSSRHDDLFGILNGVDTEVWNPATDPHIAQNYTAATVAEGKAACKAELQRRLGLPVRPDVMLLGSISRMTHQKGFQLVEQCSSMLMDQDIQFVFLGSGEPRFEQLLTKLAESHPGKVATHIGYDEPLSHQIEAGADAFLMPSEFEPCGLNQMYSLLYGTVPIVRAVGGLADSVVDASDENLANRTANGFAFREFRSDVLFWNICRARALFADKQKWSSLQQTGMKQDWSWTHSANEYQRVYELALEKRRNPRPTSDSTTRSVVGG
ncbi:glycogen synthase GlgA [Schlesneria sp.]|uniref:glycogen synthase GlgA n=1 Tax=Schlesneria sp. TaxID=2762018 RepID=UPI002F12333F